MVISVSCRKDLNLSDTGLPCALQCGLHSTRTGMRRIKERSFKLSWLIMSLPPFNWTGGSFSAGYLPGVTARPTYLEAEHRRARWAAQLEPAELWRICLKYPLERRLLDIVENVRKRSKMKRIIWNNWAFDSGGSNWNPSWSPMESELRSSSKNHRIGAEEFLLYWKFQFGNSLVVRAYWLDLACSCKFRRSGFLLFERIV